MRVTIVELTGADIFVRCLADEGVEYVFGYPGGAAEGLTDEQIEALIVRRTAARQNRNWAESDRIRDELKAQGIILEDTAGQTTWRRL